VTSSDGQPGAQGAANAGQDGRFQGRARSNGRNGNGYDSRTAGGGSRPGQDDPRSEQADEAGDHRAAHVCRTPRAKGPIGILTNLEFIAGFEPLDYVIEDVLPRYTLYALTGKPKTGKTGVALTIVLFAAMGWPLAGHDIDRPMRVLYLAGENANNVMMRWMLCWSNSP
jgi:hypothetical protein